MSKERDSMNFNEVRGFARAPAAVRTPPDPEVVATPAAAPV